MPAMKWLHRITFALAYLRHPPWDSGLVPPELQEFVGTHPAGRALDLGCGTGTSSLALAGAGWQVTGVDFVARAIRLARRKAEAAGLSVDFLIGDVTRLPRFPHLFDLVLDVGCFHSLDGKGKSAYREQMGRLLAPGGTWLVYAFVRGAGEAGPGVIEREIRAAAPGLRLYRRQDGSERGWRPSAWFWFERD
jgi:SAM-dependent methyltransferase